MRPVTITVTNTGTSAPVMMDALACPFNVGIGCVISGAPVYNVEHSFEYPPANWFINANINGGTISADTNYMFPVRAIRLHITGVGNATDSVTMTILQGSNSG